MESLPRLCNRDVDMDALPGTSLGRFEAVACEQLKRTGVQTVFARDNPRANQLPASSRLWLIESRRICGGRLILDAAPRGESTVKGNVNDDPNDVTSIVGAR